MTVVNSNKDDAPKIRRKPPTTPEAMQNRLIALAHEEAERQLIGGTASSQIITALIREGSQRAELELQKLRQDTSLAAAKVIAMESAANSQKLFEEAMSVFKGYQPSMDDDIA